MHGLHRWHNEYNVETLGRPGAVAVEDPWDLLDAHDRRRRRAVPARPSSARPTTWSRRSATSTSTTGGFGVVLGFAHDWANREATFRSWDLFARYVIPEINGCRPATSGRRSSTSTTTRPS